MFDEDTLRKLHDRSYRLDNMYSILDKDGNLVNFVPNIYQRRFDENKHGRDIILKSRQLGMTSFCVVDAFDYITTTPNAYCMFIAHQKRESDAILKNKIPILWNNFGLRHHMFYKLQVDQSGEFRIGFDEKDESINSFIRAGTSGVSGTYSYMHISELAVMEKEEKGRAEEVLRGTLAVPYDGRIVIESTARGNMGVFHDMFMEAYDRTQSGYKLLPTEYKAHFYNWFDDPEIHKVAEVMSVNKMKNADFFQKTMSDYKLNIQQINWFYSKFAQLRYDLNLLLAEYPRSIADAFRASNNAYFNQELVDMHPTRQPIAVHGGWKFFSMYNRSHQYCLGADPSGGKGGDNATIIVLDCTIGEVCAEYCNKFTPPAQLADEINNIGRKYGNCLAGIEVNNHGHAVIERLKNLNYPNLYSRFNLKTYDDEETEQLGFLTTSSTKPAILSNLSLGINTFSVMIVSDTLKQEILRYPREDVDKLRSDESVGHYDRIMALAIAYEMRKYVSRNSKLVTS